MRSDMNKVMVDCYRVGGSDPRPGRIPRDLADLPLREGIRFPYKKRYGDAKDFGENLSPLYRWLDKQVGRPWDKVFSELNKGFDRRKVINNHIFEHVEGHVAQAKDIVVDDNGDVFEKRTFRGSRYPVRGLYVHPVTGLLRRVDPQRAKNAEAERQRKEAAEVAQRRRTVDATTQLHKKGESWFVVTLAKVEPLKLERRSYTRSDGTVDSYDVPLNLQQDVMLKRRVNGRYGGYKTGQEMFELYGIRGVFAIEKHAASHRELKKYGVR